MVKDFLSNIEDSIWNQEDSYICYFRQISNGSIILEKCNPTYLYYNGLHREDVGKCLEALFPEEYVYHVCKTYETAQHITDCLSMIREAGGAYWDTNIYFEGNRIKISARKLNGILSEKISDRYLNYFNFNRLQEHDNHCLILRRQEDGRYCVESCSGQLDRLFCISLSGCTDFAQVLKKHFLWFRSASILDDCLRAGKPLRVLELFHRNSEHKYILATLSPMSGGGENRIIITGCRLDEEEYFRMQQPPVDMFNDLYESRYLGLCLIVLQTASGQNSPYPLKTNPFFDTILKEKGLNLSDITASAIMRNCIKRKSISAGSVTLPDSKCTGRFFLCAIPTENNNRYLLALSPKENISGSTNNLFSSLTQREHEVINYVVDGKTNKQIACVLDISEGTVKKIIYNAYQKLHIASRIDLIKLVLIS